MLRLFLVFLPQFQPDRHPSVRVLRETLRETADGRGGDLRLRCGVMSPRPRPTHTHSHSCACTCKEPDILPTHTHTQKQTEYQVDRIRSSPSITRTHSGLLRPLRRHRTVGVFEGGSTAKVWGVGGVETKKKTKKKKQNKN